MKIIFKESILSLCLSLIILLMPMMTFADNYGIGSNDIENYNLKDLNSKKLNNLNNISVREYFERTKIELSQLFDKVEFKDKDKIKESTLKLIDNLLSNNALNKIDKKYDSAEDYFLNSIEKMKNRKLTLSEEYLSLLGVKFNAKTGERIKDAPDGTVELLGSYFDIETGDNVGTEVPEGTLELLGSYFDANTGERIDINQSNSNLTQLDKILSSLMKFFAIAYGSGYAYGYGLGTYVINNLYSYFAAGVYAPSFFIAGLYFSAVHELLSLLVNDYVSEDNSAYIPLEYIIDYTDSVSNLYIKLSKYFYQSLETSIPNAIAGYITMTLSPFIGLYSASVIFE
jgi:hypothetical protein